MHRAISHIYTKLHRLRQPQYFNKIKAAIVVLVFAAVGSGLLLATHAVTPSANIEPENAVVTGSAATGTAATASGGRYVQFGGNKCAGVQLLPSFDIQNAIEANPDGTTFCLAAGIYRLNTTINPKIGNSFIGVPGTVVNGSKVVTDYAQSGQYWVLANQTPQPATGADPGVECDPNHPRCVYDDGVFLDDQPLSAVSNLSQVVAGTFYFDYPNHRIYIADNPTGHKLEVTVANLAFYSSRYATGVTISGLTVEKFANSASTGAITGGANWTVSGSEVRLSHGTGICMFPNDPNSGGWVVRNNHVHHNGQMGLCGQRLDGLVENNEIDHNNTAGFWYGWEAGGGKWVYTTRLTVRGNYVHDNTGIGLWTDGYNINTLYDNNRVENNTSIGIHHEISYDAIIRNNTIKGNGFGASSPDNAGIKINTSPNVEIYNNTLDANASGLLLVEQQRSDINGPSGTLSLTNNYVHDNQIWMPSGTTGLVQGVGDDSYYQSRNNRFVNNHYKLGNLNGPAFYWLDAARTKDQWIGYGQDTAGTFTGF